jgi:hypothetical protein
LICVNHTACAGKLLRGAQARDGRHRDKPAGLWTKGKLDLDALAQKMQEGNAQLDPGNG